MQRFLLFIIATGISVCSYGQQKPKLVVGIVVDQMRQDYLYRFEENFSDEGFKKLMNEGYMYKNVHFNYVPTYTAPGHASVYTGTTPAIHGVIGNDWYSREKKDEIYCAEDDTEQTVGSTTDNGQMSPRNLLTTTIGDELRISNQKRSKVIGLSIKDRGAVFPAGHTGEAFWYDKKAGDFISSTYYGKILPKWVSDFNDKNRADYYLGQIWEPSTDLTSSIADENAYEDASIKETPVFPYALKKGEYWQIRDTPFGNDILSEIAIEAINNAGLGQDDYTDLLAISFSSTDYIGHDFGPSSKEVEDTYERLDKNIAQIIKALDKKVGEGNYMIFLTADHAVAEVPQYLIDQNVPAGYFNESLVFKLNEKLAAKFGEGNWIENISNEQVFLNRDMISQKDINLHHVQDYLAHLLLDLEGIAVSYPAHIIAGLDYNSGGIKGKMVRGYNQSRSGDVLMAFEPGWMVRNKKGSTHGSSYTYDTHVPLLWHGAGIKKGQSVEYQPITNIAPTLSMILNISLPNGATGKPLLKLFE